MWKPFPAIDMEATGENIKRLRIKSGMTIRDIQERFNFKEPRAIYKWQTGETLPSVDNLFALSDLFGVRVDQIIVRRAVLTLVNEPEENGSVFLRFLMRPRMSALCG